MDIEGFEPILSDEDIVDDTEHYQDVDYDYSSYSNNDDIIKLFIPGTTELQECKIQLPFVVNDIQFEIDEEFRILIGIADDFFKSSITKYTLNEFDGLDREIKEELVHLCEKVVTVIDDVKYFCYMVQIYVKVVVMMRKYSEFEEEVVTQVMFQIFYYPKQRLSSQFSYLHSINVEFLVIKFNT